MFKIDLLRIDTLGNRLTFSYACAFTLFLLCAFAAAFFALDSLLNTRLQEDLEEDLEEFQTSYLDGGIARTLEDIGDEIKSGDQSEIFFRVIGTEGEEVFLSSMNSWTGLREQLDQKNIDEFPYLHRIKIPSQDHTTQIIQGYLSPQGHLIQIGESTEENAEIMQILLLLLIAMSVLVLPLAYGIGWLVSQQAVKDIKAVSNAALDIEQGNLDRRVEISHAGKEIQQLSERFNAMAQRIRQLVTGMQEMIDNIAHDLRSPITRIRASAEIMSSSSQCGQGSAQVIQECDGLIELINNTLDVSEAEAGVIQGQAELIDMGQLTNDVCELFEPAMEEHCLQLRCETSSILVRGYRDYLQRLIANLLDNALKYTPKDGIVTIKLSNGGNSAILTIEDSGIGIPEKDISRVFDRFFRGDQSRPQRGSGLGLSFCRAVVRAHQGSIQVASKVGRGTLFTLLLPVAN